MSKDIEFDETEDSPRQVNTVNRNQFGSNPNRRSVLKTLGAIGVGVTSVSRRNTAVTTNVTPPSTQRWSDDSFDVYTSSDGPIDYETNLASAIKNTHSFDNGKGEILQNFRLSTESVSKINEGGGWENEPGIRTTRMDVYDSDNTDILVEGTGDNLGARPPVGGGGNPKYPGVVSDLFGVALSLIHPYLGYAKTAADIVNSLINGTSPDSQKDRVSWVWDYPKSGGATQVPNNSYHSKFTIRSPIGEQAKNTVTSSMYWHSISNQWLNTGWDVYYDGHDPNGSASNLSKINSFQEAVEQSPNPPENPDKWTYVPVPDDFEPTRILVNKLPKHSPVRQAVDVEYVTHTQTPLWIRPITDDSSDKFFSE